MERRKFVLYCLVLRLSLTCTFLIKDVNHKNLNTDYRAGDGEAYGDGDVKGEGDGVGDDGEGIVEEYILARQGVESELEDFYQNAPPGIPPDLESDAMIQLKLLREKLSTSGLPAKDLEEILDGDPGLLALTQARAELHSVQKRAIEISEKRRWTGGIVPYVFRNDTTASHQTEILRTIATYERFTCMRFVPWEEIDGVTTNQKLGLDHEGYLKFVVGSGCWSFAGNLRKTKNGQDISCCGGSTCVHEVGHALGEHHEHQSPDPDRQRFIRINIGNIKQDYVNFFRTKIKVFSEGYDVNNRMHYTQGSFSLPGKKTFTMFFPELPTSRNFYYLLREVSIMHKCQDKCPDSKFTCDNDGFLTLVDNKCACRCIPGLDPATGCTTIYKRDPQDLAFPGGQYALPAPSAGCPDGSFVPGSRTQFNDGGNSKSNPWLMAGKVAGKIVEHQFCAKDSDPNDFFVWPAGNYCIYRRGGSCPEGFMEGFIQYDDHPTDSTPNSVSGELPDGIFNVDTRFEYCCKDTGFTQDEIYLPSRKPFSLIKRSNKNCHKVRGMHVVSNNLRINNADEDGKASIGGDSPRFKVDSKTNAYWTSFCHYTPAMIDCGEIIELNSSKPEVTITSPTAPELECYWLIKAPPGERLQMDFSDFDIKGTPGNCEDQLEVRYVRMGQPGVTYCGRRWDKTTITVNNTIHMRLTTKGDSSSHFTATVKLVPNADLCYAAFDRGMTYAGDVNFTRYFEPCLPWHEVTHCEMHPFKTDAFTTVLEGNKCRNPDQATGFYPWCYTQAEGCIRHYCDVCGIGKRYDAFDNCGDINAEGQCSLEACAETCADQYPPPSVPVRASEVRCGAPGDVVDGSVVGDKKASYAVGESVTYKCVHGDHSEQRYCLTSGEWSAMGTACVECPEGYTLNEDLGQCYYYPNRKGHNNYAREFCQNKGAFIAFPNSEKENVYLRNLTTDPRSKIWLGIDDKITEGTFLTAEGDPLPYTNWASKQPNNYANTEDCVDMRPDGTWYDMNCEAFTRHFICQKPMIARQECLEYSDQCAKLFSLKPSMCRDFPSFAKERCPFACGVCGPTNGPTCKIQRPGSGEEIELTRGQIMEDSCAEGFIRVAGDAVRGCTATGQLTGSPLKCVQTCPPDWTLNVDNLHCYRWFKGPKSFEAAQADCESMKGIVTVAKNKKEMDFVKTVKENGNVWLGLQDSETEGKWKWLDGSIATWSNWQEGQPNNGGKSGEDCVMMVHKATWQDVSCTTRSFAYVCKVPLHMFG